MRKRNKKTNIFSRPKNQREALLKSLATSLFLHEKITTTQSKAKELRILAERIITRAKTGALADRKVIAKTLAPRITKKVVGEIAPRFSLRQGGYTRIVNLGPRKSDGASMAIIELVK